MDSKLAAKKARFLSNIERALKQMSSTSTEESTTIDKIILRDLVQLENNASSGSMSLSGDSDPQENQCLGEGFIVLENPMTFTHRLN